MLFGCKTDAWFDLWTFEHFITGIGLGSSIALLRTKCFRREEDTLRFDCVWVLFIAYAWEATEHYLETGAAGNAVTYWFQGVEYWGNRLIADPLSVLLGWLTWRRYKALLIPARLFSVAWLYFHLFVFPHSMYIHVRYLHNCPTLEFPAGTAPQHTLPHVD